jgi:tripartite-type tricarboxylate transporter receptor subunit TctC
VAADREGFRRAAGMTLQEGGVMRRAAVVVAAIFGLSLGGTSAPAQTFPDRLIKTVVPYVPGSPVDVLARVLAPALGARLGQNVIVENRPGAGTTSGMKGVISATPDGYTLLVAGQALAYAGVLYPDLGFDPATAFTPVTTLAGWSHVLVVGPSLQVHSVAELVAHAKTNPGKLTFGFGLGTAPQIVGDYFKAVAGLDITDVPYRGGEQVRIDLLGGRIDINFAPVSNVIGMIQEGKVRPLAVTSHTRDPNLPDVPTMIESGYPQVGFNPDVWQAIVAPPGTPGAVVNKLNAEILESLKRPEVLATLAKLGFNPMGCTPQELATFLADQTQKWAPVLKAANVQPQ